MRLHADRNAPKNPSPTGSREAGGPPSARARWGVASLLVVVTFAAYAAVAGHGFLLYDDPKYVTQNSHVREGLTLAGLRWAWTTDLASNWHPLTWMSHMLDQNLFGSQPAGPHLSSLFLHAANTLLLFLLLEWMTGSTGRSAFVAALFGLHPLHVESVAWVSERKDVLSTFFWFLATFAYVRWTRSPRPARYLLVVLLVALGLTAKPMVVTLPFTLLLLDFWPLQRFRAGTWRLVVEKLPLLALSAASCVVTFLVQRSGGAVASLERRPMENRIANALISIAAYLRKTVWPSDLAAFYPYPTQLPAAWQIAGALLLVVLVSILALRERRRSPYLLMGWLWYLGTLVPVIGLVQVGLQSMADRYTYVPLVGIFVMVAWGIPDLVARRSGNAAGSPARWLAIPAVAVLLALAGCTWVQVGYWRDSKTLFEHALNVTTDNSVAHADLGIALVDDGRIEDAITHYRESLRIRPDHAPTHTRLGEALERLGRTDEARGHFERALVLDPGLADAHASLGHLLEAEGKTREAIEHLETAIRLNPGDTTPRAYLEHALRNEPQAQSSAGIPPGPGAEQINELGVELARSGRLDEAIKQFRKAIEQQPDLARVHINLGLALAGKGRFDDAVAAYRRALEIDPRDPEAHANLGVALATLGRLPEAIAHYEDALRARPRYPEALNNLGGALIGIGRADEAGDRIRAALALRPDYAKAHYNLAVALFAKGDYSGAWNEIGTSRRLGFEPPERFLRMLTARMPAPG